MKYLLALLLALSFASNSYAMKRISQLQNYENATFVAKVEFFDVHHPIIGADAVDIKILEMWKGTFPKNFTRLKLTGRACDDAPSLGMYIVFLNEEDLKSGVQCSSLKMFRIQADMSREKFLEYAKHSEE